MPVFLTAGLLYGCNGVDEDEPDPSEELSEQREDNSQCVAPIHGGAFLMRIYRLKELTERFN